MVNIEFGKSELLEFKLLGQEVCLYEVGISAVVLCVYV